MLTTLDVAHPYLLEHAGTGVWLPVVDGGDCLAGIHVVTFSSDSKIPYAHAF